MRKLRNPHAVVPGGRARSKMSDVIAFHRHKDRSENGADGISDIEGKAARVAASERGQRGSFNGAVGNCDMAGIAARWRSSAAGSSLDTMLGIRVLCLLSFTCVRGIVFDV